MSLTFLDIQNAVLADGFDESKRSDCKNWINFRHSWLWDLDDWTFKYTTATVTFTANTMAVGDMPADFHAAVSLFDSNGWLVKPMADYREFYSRYNQNLQNGTGSPEAWTVIGGVLTVGPAGDGSEGILVYEKTKPALVMDGDTTGLPDGYDLALVHGGKAEGFKLANVPLWQGFDDDFTAAAQTLRQNYLTQVKAASSRQFGAYKPGVQWR